MDILVSRANTKNEFNFPLFTQDHEGQNTNNGIKYKLQLLYANGKKFPEEKGSSFHDLFSFV